MLSALVLGSNPSGATNCFVSLEDTAELTLHSSDDLRREVFSHQGRVQFLPALNRPEGRCRELLYCIFHFLV